MRRMLATVLLVCFGILIPLAASPLRVCLLEKAVFSSVFFAVDSTMECCPDCERDSAPTEDPCCVDMKKLPDTSAPQPPLEVPPAILAELPQPSLPTPVLVAVACMSPALSASIRGPTSPAAYRAVLGIWRL